MDAQTDFEVEYNNRARVPEHPALLADWARDSAAYRAASRWRTLHYGSGERHVIDVFPADEVGHTVMYIHGGYWQALDGSSSSNLARGLNARGISVAIPSYDLCPNVSVADIVTQMRHAARELMRLGRRLVVCGHSAGGHLAACLLATDWTAEAPDLPADPVVAAYTISGLFDLGPLVETSVNRALRLDAASAHAASPLFWPAPRRGSLDAVVGGEESSEYHRQSKMIVEAWGEAGLPTRFGTIAGANHFTVTAPMADPQSAMTARLAELAMGRAS